MEQKSKRNYLGWIYVDKSPGYNDAFKTSKKLPDGSYENRSHGHAAEGAARAVDYFEKDYGPIKLEQTPLGFRVFRWETLELPQHKPVTRQEFEDAIASITVEEKMSGRDLAAAIKEATGLRSDADSDNQLATLTNDEVREVFQYLEKDPEGQWRG